MGGPRLDIEADFYGRFAGERHQHERADSDAEDFRGNRGFGSGLIFRLVFSQQIEIGLHPRQGLHGVDIFIV